MTESGGTAGFVPPSSRGSCVDGAVVVHVGDIGRTFTRSKAQDIAGWYIWVPERGRNVDPLSCDAVFSMFCSTVEGFR